MDRTIALTILQQMGGSHMLEVMVGADNFVADENSVKFRFKMNRKMNLCKVTLTPMDTYIMEFWNIRAKSGVCKMVRSYDDVYFDMLIPVFEETTGLCLGLRTR